MLPRLPSQAGGAAHVKQSGRLPGGHGMVGWEFAVVGDTEPTDRSARGRRAGSGRGKASPARSIAETLPTDVDVVTLLAVAAGCGPGRRFLSISGCPVAAVCVCDTYFTVNGDGELCLKPGTVGLRRILTFKEPGTFQFEKADYPWLARVKVRVQGGGGGSARVDASKNECSVRPGGVPLSVSSTPVGSACWG